MLRIGVLGAGVMARMHADSIMRSGTAKVTKVYDAVAELGGALASKCECAIAPTAEEVMNDPNIDAVVIATPTESHARYLEMAHAGHKHIFCEKPVVRTEAEIARIEQLFAGYDKKVTIGHVLHFCPEYRNLRDTVASGVLGQIGTARFTRCASFPRGRAEWFASYDHSGGVILDLSIHDLDAVRWCFGEVERVFSMRSGGRENLRNDYALTVARLKSGAIAHMEASWVEASGTFYYGYEVAGSTGLLDFDSRVEPTLTIQQKIFEEGKQPETLVIQNPAKMGPYEIEMRSFLNAVANDTPVEVTLEDGIRTVQLALAALRSAEENRPVTLA